MRTRFASAGAALLTMLALSAGPAAAQDVFGSLGSSVYDSDAFCLDSGAFFTDYALGISGDLLGASAAYAGDWPWPPPFPPGGGSAVVPATFLVAPAAGAQRVYLAHGDAFRGVIDVFALGLVRRLARADDDGLLARIDDVVRPVFGVGVQISSDGDPAPAGARGAETYGVRGDTNLLIQYGARVYLPSRARRIRAQIEYRGTSLFADEFKLETPAAEVIRVEGATRNFGVWSVGVSVRLGG